MRHTAQNYAEEGNKIYNFSISFVIVNSFYFPGSGNSLLFAWFNFKIAQFILFFFCSHKFIKSTFLNWSEKLKLIFYSIKIILFRVNFFFLTFFTRKVFIHLVSKFESMRVRAWDRYALHTHTHTQKQLNKTFSLMEETEAIKT